MWPICLYMADRHRWKAPQTTGILESGLETYLTAGNLYGMIKTWQCGGVSVGDLVWRSQRRNEPEPVGAPWDVRRGSKSVLCGCRHPVTLCVAEDSEMQVSSDLG